MLANGASRRLIGGWRRTFSTATPLRRSSGKATNATTLGPTSRWTGRSVFALTASAGLVGFGLATVVLDKPSERTASLFNDKTPGPKYASVKEMERVCDRKYPLYAAKWVEVT